MSAVLTRSAKNIGKNQDNKQVDRITTPNTTNEDKLAIILEKIKSTNQGIAHLNHKFDKLYEEIHAVKQVTKRNTSDICKLNMKMDSLGQFCKRCTLRFFEVPECQNENCIRLILNIIRQDMNLTSVSENDIEAGYRVVSSNKNEPRPVMAKFCSMQVKTQVYSNKKKLKGKRITVREDLSLARMKMVKEKIAVYGKQNVWTQDGKIKWLENGKLMSAVPDMVADISGIGSLN
nr:unnamed protein product [Callosobruchus analis]